MARRDAFPRSGETRVISRCVERTADSIFVMLIMEDAYLQQVTYPLARFHEPA